MIYLAVTGVTEINGDADEYSGSVWWEEGFGAGREFGEYMSFDTERPEAKCNYAHRL